MVASRRDSDIERDVSKAFGSDARINPTNVDVSVREGVVHLQGNVPSLFQKRTASEITSRIRGVTDIVNDLQVTPTTQRSDEEIAEDVQDALRRDARLDASGITVKVVGGVVHLAGTVPSYTDKSHVESDARSVRGVVDVASDLHVLVRARSDEEIAEEIRDDLARSIRLDPSKVEVQVKNKVAYLRGSVPIAEQKWLVEDLAWMVAGVQDVVNELRVMP